MSEHTPTKMSEHSPERFPAFTVDDVSEHKPDLMPEQAPEHQIAFQGGSLEAKYIFACC